jgi:hypothetical protein
MTETTTTEGQERQSSAPLCRAGSATENPCRRPATVAPWPDDGTEPMLCAEHFKARHLGEELDGWLFARETLGAFLEGPVQDDPTGDLTQLCYHWHEHVTKEAASTAHKFAVAWHLADHAPSADEEEAPESPTMREMMAHLLERADELTTARAILGGDSKFSETETLAALDALEEARAKANEDLEKFRAGQRLTE